MQSNSKIYSLFFELSAVLAAVLFIIPIVFLAGNSIEKKEITISHNNPSVNQGVISNYANGVVSEIAFMSSLYREDQLTMLGSSEFSDNPNASYNFLPKQFGIASVGFGHAYHQSFTMFCELLAANEYLPNSKVVFIISPSWFETEGTNPEAFLEFVPPNFLERIWTDESISSKYKYEIGRYLSDNEDNFSGINSRMKSFIDFYRGEKEKRISYRLKDKIETSVPNLKRGVQYKYSLQQNPMSTINDNFSFSEKIEEARKSFLLKCSTNDIFVDSTYYRLHLPLENGKLKKGRVAFPEAKENREYQDFLLLLDLLKKRNVDCRFIIQSLNPCYFENLSDFNPLLGLIEEKLKENHFEYLNMFVDNRKEYQPGTLNDIMHFGDLGWLKVNEFLLKTYSK